MWEWSIIFCPSFRILWFKFCDPSYSKGPKQNIWAIVLVMLYISIVSLVSQHCNALIHTWSFGISSPITSTCSQQVWTVYKSRGDPVTEVAPSDRVHVHVVHFTVSSVLCVVWQVELSANLRRSFKILEKASTKAFESLCLVESTFTFKTLWC